MRDNCTVADLKHALRNPVCYGGYTLAFWTRDGARLCPKCIRDNFRQVLEDKADSAYGGQWAVDWIDVYWEGPTEECAHCGIDLPSEYGDPNEDGDDGAPRGRVFHTVWPRG